jgi:hypothetical protein
MIDVVAGSGAVSRGELEWVIPKGYPTREVILASLGEPTTNLVRLLEECFGVPATTRIPANNSIACEMVILRGLIQPESDQMTARCKILMRTSDAEDETYAEFFLNMNTLAKKIWVSEKALEYRAPILGWATGQIQRPSNGMEFAMQSLSDIQGHISSAAPTRPANVPTSPT